MRGTILLSLGIAGLVVGTLLLGFAPGGGPAPAVGSTIAGYRHTSASGTLSLNWAGYAVTGGAGAYSSVSGSWIAPAVTCGQGSQYAAFWVGIDGFNSNTVEQTGILAQCSSGAAKYSAWYEFYPASPVYAPASDAVVPGDAIHGTVTFASGTFTATLVDATRGWTYTSPATAVSGAARSSAECIAERPAIGGSLTKLANFGTASFGQDYTSVSGTCDANGAAFGPSATAITMVGRSGKVLAQTSALSSDGTSFTVTWKGSN